MVRKPGVLLVRITKDSDYAGEEEVTHIYLSYNGYSEKYAQELEILINQHARTLQDVLGGYYIIETLRFDGANNLGEAKFAAACLVLFDTKMGVRNSRFVEYDTNSFNVLLDRVTKLVKEFKTDTGNPEDEYDYSKYVLKHIDSLIRVLLKDYNPTN